MAEMLGLGNTAVGFQALAANTSGGLSVAVGNGALKVSIGSGNTAVGAIAQALGTTGEANTAVGQGALQNNLTGSSNIALGAGAGFRPTAPAESIFIGNPGLVADTSTIKISIGGIQTTAFVAGIRSITTGLDDAVPVLIDSNGQLRTISSSRHYKEDIRPMGSMSSVLAELRPVTFRYKKPYADGSKPIQYGLIAEEVAGCFQTSQCSTTRASRRR